MKQEDKELLLKDLCARLPYGVKVLDNSHKDYGVSELINIGVDGSMLVDNEINDIQYYPIIDEIKPYLRPMSSMTDEEVKELYILLFRIERLGFPDIYKDQNTISSLYDWLNGHYFDYRGLIPKGLALEAPEGMYRKGE